MGRSSRISVFLLFSGLLAIGLSVHAGAHGSAAMMRAPLMRPVVVVRPRAPTGPVIRQAVNLRREPARRARWRFGTDGVGLGLATVADLTRPPLGPEEPVVAGAGLYAPLPPCVRPRLIRIGLMRHRMPPIRVVYGPPIGCAP
jgi:hypothetical protein